MFAKAYITHMCILRVKRIRGNEVRLCVLLRIRIIQDTTGIDGSGFVHNTRGAHVILIYWVGKYQFLYFHVRGRGQAIRYMLVDNNIDFDDVVAVTKVEDWPKIKPNMPFGQLPVLKDGDFVIPQSNTIMRYIARKHDLYPTDYQESAKVDMINDHVEDMRVAYLRLIYHNYTDGKADYIAQLPTKFFENLEKLLKSWGKDFINDKLSFADYNLFDCLDIHLVLAPGCLDAFPTLKAYYEKILNRPKIKALRETEDFKSMKINGNDNQ